MPERSKGVDSSSTVEKLVGSNPTPYNILAIKHSYCYYLLILY